MADAGVKSKRPLSPHLGVYRWTWTMAGSVLHRITGIALYGASLFLVWYLVTLASGPTAFDDANAFFGSWFGQLILFGITFVLVLHAMGGIRHFVWNLGIGMGKRARDALAFGSVAGSVVITILIWVAVFLAR